MRCLDSPRHGIRRRSNVNPYALPLPRWGTIKPFPTWATAGRKGKTRGARVKALQNRYSTRSMQASGIVPARPEKTCHLAQLQRGRHCARHFRNGALRPVFRPAQAAGGLLSTTSTLNGANSGSGSRIRPSFFNSSLLASSEQKATNSPGS